jgi:hypothetical protein
MWRLKVSICAVLSVYLNGAPFPWAEGAAKHQRNAKRESEVREVAAGLPELPQEDHFRNSTKPTFPAVVRNRTSAICLCGPPGRPPRPGHTRATSGPVGGGVGLGGGSGSGSVSRMGRPAFDTRCSPWVHRPRISTPRKTTPIGARSGSGSGSGWFASTPPPVTPGLPAEDSTAGPGVSRRRPHAAAP